MAVADVFDALISVRTYKAAMSSLEARNIIAAESGKHFDPGVVDAFLTGFGDFVAIVEHYRDAGRASPTGISPAGQA